MALMKLVVLALAGHSVHAFTPSVSPTFTRSSLVPRAALKPSHEEPSPIHKWTSPQWLTRVGASLAAAAVILTSSMTAQATDSKVVGQISGSGLVFKDTLAIERFDDPKVKGVTLYVSNFERPITERLTSNLFAEPSYASVACAKTGPVSVADNIATGNGGEQVFAESKSLMFKTLRVQRIYDQERNTVVYVSYNTRLDKSDDSNKSRFKSSLCAVNLDDGSSSSVSKPES